MAEPVMSVPPSDPPAGSADRARPAAKALPRWTAIVVLCVGAALLPETVLTSSTPVAALLVNPVALVYLAAFYGTALLLVREAVVRRRIGWPGVVLLGIAFGICNEAVVAGTWYTVANTGYVFVGPVDVAWAVGLTVFHLFVSVIGTLAFADALVPSRAGAPLLRRRGIGVAAGLFLLCNAPALLAATFRPERAAALLAAAALVALAFLAPHRPGPGDRHRPEHASRHGSAQTAPPPPLWALRLAGFAAYAVYFLLLYLLPALLAQVPGLPVTLAQALVIGALVAFAALVLARGVAWTRRTGWGLPQATALLAGAVAVALLLSVLVPAQRGLLQPVATAPTFLFLLWRTRQLRRRAGAGARPDAAREPLLSRSGLNDRRDRR